ncbi:LOW QUALITY PROTEIN: cytochrome P450 93A3-like [Wolffia australiana]
MDDEMHALIKNHTWDVVPLPPGKKAVGCKWVHTPKHRADGSLERRKSRLVARGFTQSYGVDYFETFSPVAKMEFEEVYMSHPPGYSLGPPRTVCRLRKSLYGLKQSPRMWFGRFSSVMRAEGYTQSNGDATIFLRRGPTGVAILVVYVDDILITGSDTVEASRLGLALAREFEIKALGPLRYFLDLEVAYSSRGIFVSQHKYTVDLLTLTGMTDCSPLRTPIDPTVKLGEGGDSPPVNHYQYQMLAANRVLAYLKGCPGKGLLFPRSSDTTMKVYTDADFAVSVVDYRSTTGYCAFVFGGLVSWKSSKQDKVSHSSAEAEFQALADGASEGQWIYGILRELRVKYSGPIHFYCDNKLAIALTKNPGQTGRIKHMEPERKHMHLIENALTLIEHASLSSLYWDKVFAIATFSSTAFPRCISSIFILPPHYNIISCKRVFPCKYHQMALLISAKRVSWPKASANRKSLWRRPHSNLPPGPLGVPVLGSLPFLRSDLHNYFKELADVYGPVLSLRLGSKLCVVFSSPESVKEVLKDQDITFANHNVPIVAEISFYGGRDIAWSPYGPYWRMVRKITVRELLNPATIAGLCHLRTAEIRRMEEKVLGMAGQPLDLRGIISTTTLNIVTEMLWGGGVTRDSVERETLEREFNDALVKSVEPLGTPNVSDFFPALACLDLQGLAHRSRKLASWLDNILNRIIEERLRSTPDVSEEKRCTDFLQVLLDLTKKPDQEIPLTLDAVKGIILDMLTGGTDSTTTTEEWAMAELLHHPEILKKAVEEISNVVGKGNRVEEAHLPNLKYLDLVIKETLRLHPALPLLIPRHPTRESTVGGYRIPEGTLVFLNIWAIQRNPKLSDKASTFVPERFSREEGRMEHDGDDFCYLPFGSGRRSCAGVLLAQRITKFILASLLLSANWAVPQEELAEWGLQDKFQSILKKEKPLVLVPSKR